MQKIFNYTCVVAAMLCLFSFAMPATYAAENSNYSGQLVDTVTTITSLGGYMQETLIFFIDTFDVLVGMFESVYEWLSEVVSPVVKFFSDAVSWIMDGIYNILEFFGAENADIPVIPEFGEEDIVDIPDEGYLPSFGVL